MHGAPVGGTRLVIPAPLSAFFMEWMPQRCRAWPRPLLFRALPRFPSQHQWPDPHFARGRSMTMRQPHHPSPRCRDFLSASPDPATLIMPSGFRRNRALRFLEERRAGLCSLASHDVHPVAGLPLAWHPLGRRVWYAFQCAVPGRPLHAAQDTAAREPLVEDGVTPWLTQATAVFRVGLRSCFLPAFAVLPVQDRIPSRFCGDGLRRPLRLLGTAWASGLGVMPCRA